MSENIDTGNFNYIQYDKNQGLSLDEELENNYNGVFINNNQVINTEEREKSESIRNISIRMNSSSRNRNSLLRKKTKRPKSKKTDKNKEKTTKKFKVTHIPKDIYNKKTSLYTSSLQNNEEGKKETINRDNYIKSILKTPYPSFVKVVEEYGEINNSKLKLKRVNLKNVFGGTIQNKISIKWKLYQIICFNKDNQTLLEQAKPKNEAIFKLILSCTYEDLLKIYYNKGIKNLDIKKKYILKKFFKTFDEVKKNRKVNYYSNENFDPLTSVVLNDFMGRAIRKRQKNVINDVVLIKKFEISEEKENEYLHSIKQQIKINANNEKKKEQFPNDHEPEKRYESFIINNGITFPNFQSNNPNFINNNHFKMINLIDENGNNNENKKKQIINEFDGQKDIFDYCLRVWEHKCLPENRSIKNEIDFEKEFQKMFPESVNTSCFNDFIQ